MHCLLFFRIISPKFNNNENIKAFCVLYNIYCYFKINWCLSDLKLHKRKMPLSLRRPSPDFQWCQPTVREKRKVIKSGHMFAWYHRILMLIKWIQFLLVWSHKACIGILKINCHLHNPELHERRMGLSLRSSVCFECCPPT